VFRNSELISAAPSSARGSRCPAACCRLAWDTSIRLLQPSGTGAEDARHKLAFQVCASCDMRTWTSEEKLQVHNVFHRSGDLLGDGARGQ
jgi:hypothetical protein